jgi:hypothetical protein
VANAGIYARQILDVSVSMEKAKYVINAECDAPCHRHALE